MAVHFKPLVLICCTPVYGHLMPMRTIAKLLIASGYEVTFVSGSPYQNMMEEFGCTYVPLEGYGDWTETDLESRWPERKFLPPRPQQLSFDIEECFMKSIPSQFEASQRGMKILREKYPGRKIIQVSEGMYSGSLPITRGARGLKPNGTLGIGIIPLSLTSGDTAPFGPGILPDTSPEGRAKHKVMDEEIHKPFFGSAEKTWFKIFEDLGCENITGRALDAVYTYPDQFLQMCTPGVEYPRTDAPSTIRFAGGLPKGHRDPMKEPPKWWDEVIKNPGKKDIVFICQGTVARNLSDLTFPTMEALQDRESTLVVVALGLKGAIFPEGTHVPANVRVADFIPFDEYLPHCAVFVTNGGYGALQHGISNGIPLVVAGAGEDKPEVCARAEWAGVAVNLRTGQPTKEALREAIDEVISNSKYKKAAQKLEAEMATFNPMTVIAKTIDELAAGKL